MLERRSELLPVLKHGWASVFGCDPAGASKKQVKEAAVGSSPRSVMDMAEVLAAAGQSSQDPLVTGSYRIGDVRHVFGSPERARVMLSFEATVTFQEGMTAFAHGVLRAATNIEVPTPHE